MTRYTTNSPVQPSIPDGRPPVYWDHLDPEQKNVITKATEVRMGKVFPPRLRDKILCGEWFQLSDRVRNLLYASDWRKALKTLERAS